MSMRYSSPFRKESRLTQRRPRKRIWRHESLEPRQMLAANLIGCYPPMGPMAAPLGNEDIGAPEDSNCHA